MLSRAISPKLLSYRDKYRAIALIGPRQSGKTTLARALFADYDYFSLENPDVRLRATEDPRGFLASIHGNCILDEIQNAPVLFSYLQEILDDRFDSRRFILTGSNSFGLNERIAQSLAGRIRILVIPPLIFDELPVAQTMSLAEIIWSGFYPAIYDRQLDPRDWYADYYGTYVQKDVRALLNIKDLQQFDRYIRVCAGHCGQLANYSRIAETVGISQPTAAQWGSVLEASYLTFRLQPHFNNFNKRVVKSPKMYFIDTGLLCFLLRIQSPEQLLTHPLWGNIFENWVIAELYKRFYGLALEPALYFWRDQHGHEIDILIDRGVSLQPIEIKAGQTFHPEWIKTLTWFNKLRDKSDGLLIYGGDQSFPFKDTSVISYQELGEIALDDPRANQPVRE